jgi:hypothetical protein
VSGISGADAIVAFADAAARYEFVMHEEATAPRASERWSGLLIVVCTLVMVSFMAMHPTLHHHGNDEVAAEMKQIASFNAFVHGTLIGLIALIWIGLWALVRRLGFDSLLVRIALGAYSLGVIAVSATATLNGFVTPSLVLKYADLPGGLETMRQAHDLAFAIEQTTGKMGIVAMSLGVIAWSIVLVRGSARVTGALGIVLAGIPVLLLAVGHLKIDFHGFGLFVLTHAIWYVMVAVLLIRERI